MGRSYEIMPQVQIISDQDSLPPRTLPDVSAVTATLNRLKLRRAKLSNDIARMRKRLRRLMPKIDTRCTKGKSTEEHLSPKPSSDYQCRLIAGNALSQTAANSKGTRQRWSRLDRACRIALMETTDSASVETIYNRIERRGSIDIGSYNHPFRAIVLAMNALVQKGEAILLNDNGSRRWCRRAQ